MSLMNLVLGIDTGGTYTDGVLMDYATRDVLATTKALTTRQNLSIGILNAIDSLPLADPGSISLVSISTTLATNAIAEGKGRRVALFLIGYDPELINAFKFAERFATSRFYYFTGGHDLFGQEQAALDLEAIRQQARDRAPEVDAFAVSAYFSPLNPEHEETAFRAISQVTEAPVVLGHTLSTKLNSVERATTATLNASLVSVLRDFIAAVRSAMRARGIQAPLMIVRGDGTLMSADMADRHAIETIHSGPAASAIGGRFLSGRDPALVIDIGGTTTDMAVVEDGQVTINEEGTSVGGYRTAVKAGNIRSFGLGGDSWLLYDKEENLRIGPARVLPLAHLASQHRRVRDELVGLAHKASTEATPDGLEYWFLLRYEGDHATDHRVADLIALLRSGPQPIPVVLKTLGLVHPLQLAGHHLIERELIGRAGLTPTDLLHVAGEYAPWDREAAEAAARAFAGMRGWSVEELTGRVLAGMAEMIAAEALQFLTSRKLAPRDFYSLRHDLGRWLFDNSLGRDDKFLETAIRVKMPIIGIGAPAAIFLPRVAELLRTELVLPGADAPAGRLYAVANAVGAVAGSVVATREALVYARIRNLSPIGYIAQVGEARDAFRQLEAAMEYARLEATRQAEAEAAQLGAVGPHTRVEEIPTGVDSYSIRASTVGSPRLMSR
jgi:N-methylhydantoinase A/oxoprolinase/acetone carboxylase beta subunit